MSFHTIRCVQSADVVGNNRILLILYKPRASHTKLRAKKISLGVVKLASEFGSDKCPKVLLRDTILVKGEYSAVETVLIEKIFN